MTSRELVIKTLEFRNDSGKVPHDLWTLPWAQEHYPQELDGIMRDVKFDIVTVPAHYREKSKVETGNPYKKGEYIDGWGCKFLTVQDGVFGEVKEPIVPAEDEDWENLSRISIPVEWLSFDQEEVNRFCSGTDKFVKADCCPRPFEQLQFIRGTENLFVDLMMQPRGMMDFIKKMHDFYCRLFTKWAKTDVDALMFMDDWGTQSSLLINPQLWTEIFKPLYKDYIDIAHSYGKKVFMHSGAYHKFMIICLIIKNKLSKIMLKSLKKKAF